MNWNKTLFKELFEQMKQYCKEAENSKNINRETARVFWNASWWVKQQIEAVESFNSTYYINAITNLDHLAWCLFENESRTENEYEPI